MIPTANPTLSTSFPTSEVLPAEPCPLCQQRALPHGDWACGLCKESWVAEGSRIEEGRAALAAVIKEIEQVSEPVPPTTLSAAIRRGALLRPQAFREYFMRHEGGEVRSCTMAAAWEGLGNAAPGSDEVPGLTGKPEDWHRFAASLKAQLVIRWPILAQTWEGPWYGGEVAEGRPSLFTYITQYLNDKLGLSREEIADWLESVGQ